MTFDSILFPSGKDRPPSEAVAPPDFFVDLNLDQVVAAITKGKEEYNLTPFFRWPLHDVDAVLYRHEVMRDLEDVFVFDKIKDFATAIHAMRETLKELAKRHYKHQKAGAVPRCRYRLLRRDRLPEARFGRREPTFARPPVIP